MKKSEPGLECFIELYQAAPDKKIAQDLLDLFLTQEEKKDIALRYHIIKALLAGEKTQREIAKELNVSIAKITRGSNELKRMNTKLIQHLKQQLL